MADFTAVTNPLVLTMSENATVRPVFRQAPEPTPTPTVTPPSSPFARYTVTLTVNDALGGRVEFTNPTAARGLTQYVGSVGESIFFSARENSGYEFIGWYLNGTLWAQNRDPGIINNRTDTYEARFRKIVNLPETCQCYFIAPTDSAPSFEMQYRDCTTGEIKRETFTTFRNICSADFPQVIRNGQVAIPLGTDCKNNGGVCGTPPSSPPAPSSTPAPSPTATPSVTPSNTPVTVAPEPTPLPSRTPTPTPSPSPQTWKSCIDGTTKIGFPPNGYRQGIYQGDDLGTACWEPVTNLGINPPLNNIVFDYQRGSSIFPSKKEFTIDNPSFATSYNIKVVVDETLFTVEPSATFVALPRQATKFRIGVNQNNISKFGDGQTNFAMRLETTELVK